MTTNTTVLEAEQAWRKALDESERIGTVRNLKAEQDAWDTYTDLCNDIEQCQQPGCRETVPQYCYCPRHRPR